MCDTKSQRKKQSYHPKNLIKCRFENYFVGLSK